MRRTWLIVFAALGFGLLVSACGSSELASDLTPIPTLAPGETPALAQALAPRDAAATEDSGGDEGSQAEAGETLFIENCAGCHGAEDGPGPAITGMADRAATRVEGMSAEEYIHESIVDPSAHIVEGYPDIMPKNYDEQFSGEQLDQLVTYIMEESSEGGGEAEATDEPAATEEAVTEELEGAATEEAATEAPEATEETAEEAAMAAAGDPENGGTLFEANCQSCHAEEGGAGPELDDMGARAETRVEGMSAEEYVHESIVDPSAHVVEGFPDIMPKNYEEQFSDDEINDLVAFILQHQ